MKLIKINPLLSKKDVDQKGLIILTKIVTKEDKTNPLRLDALSYTGTILDQDINVKGGAIPVPPNFTVFSIYPIKLKMGKPFLEINKDSVIEYAKTSTPEEVFTSTDNSYLYVPPGVSAFYTTEMGINVMTPIQKRLDDMMFYYLDWIQNNNNVTNLKWLMGWKRLIDVIFDRIARKDGLFDEAVSCVWPFSTRGVVVPDPSLELDHIVLPYKVLRSWVKKPEFREAYGIPEHMTTKDAIRALHNKYIPVGRQPSHDRSNLLSFRLKTINDHESI